MRLSYGCLALECARRCLAHLAHHAPRCLAPERLQQPSDFGRGLDLLGQLVNRGFCSLIWQRRVVRLRLQMRAMVLFWDGRHPCIIDSKCCVLAASRVMGDG